MRADLGEGAGAPVGAAPARRSLSHVGGVGIGGPSASGPSGLRYAGCGGVLSASWAERVREFAGRADAMVLANPAVVPPTVSQGRADGLVVFLGRLGERKGIYELVEAIRQLQSDGVDLDGYWRVTVTSKRCPNLSKGFPLLQG